MKKLLTFLLLIPSLLCAQGTAPDAYDATMDLIIGGTSGVVHYPEPIAIGDEIVACVYADTLGGGTSGTYPVTDSLGNTYTLSPVALTPGPNNPTNVYMAYTHSAFAGTDIIQTGTYTNYGALQVTRIHNLSGTVNTSATTTATSPPAIGTISTSFTTTVNNAYALNCNGAGGFSDRKIIPTTNEYLATQDQQGQPTITQAHLVGRGAKSQTLAIWGGAATFGMVTLVFNPSPSIYIANNALPEAAVGVPYSAFLYGIGGTAGLTYSCTGLPSNGLTLNASTGEISGATPTFGTVSPVCTVTDGSITSATNTLSIKVGAGFSTIVIKSITTTDFNLSTTLSLPSIACGDTIHLIRTALDTHQRNGYLGAIGGVNNNVTDSHGSPVTRVVPHGGVFSSALEDDIIGPVVVPGTDVISAPNNQSSSSGNEVTAIVVSGAQTYTDVGAVNGNMFLLTSGGTVSTSLTTLVPNERAFVIAMNAGFGGVFATYTVGAPFSVTSINGELLVGDSLVASPSTVTPAVTFTSANSIDGLGIAAFALRPGLPNAACTTAKLHVESQVY